MREFNFFKEFEKMKPLIFQVARLILGHSGYEAKRQIFENGI